jgi:hypothetical protein
MLRASWKNFLQMLFVYLFRNVELNEQHWEQVLNTFDTPLKDFSMSAYDMLIQKGEKRGFERGVAQTAAQTAKQFISNLIIEFPELSDERIAKLANSTVELVKQIRTELLVNN